MLHCYECASFNYQGQCPHASNEPIGFCEEYAGTEYYKTFYGAAAACDKFRIRQHGNKCPACGRPMPVPEGA